MTCLHSYMKGFNHCLKYFQNEWKQSKKESYEKIEMKLRFSLKKKNIKILELENQIRELKISLKKTNSSSGTA